MSRRLCLTCFFASSVYLVFTFASAEALVRSYVEDFSSLQYCDTVNTTAWWDTLAREVKLYPFTLTLAGSYDTPGYALGLDVSGDHAYVADRGSGLRVVNISDPTNPIHAGAWNTPGEAYGVAINGDYAYVADSDSLQVIDISNPTNPIRVGACSALYLAYGVTVSGDYAYVADYDSGLLVIDISNPASPTFAARYDTPGRASDVTISGDYAYVADDDSLQVIDISDPTSPVRAGSCFTPGQTFRVTVTGDFLFTAELESGVQVVDISDPASPTCAGSYDTPSQAIDIAISGDYAYVADDAAGLHMLDISDPTNPIHVGTYDTSRYATHVVVSGRYAYVADHTHGLKVIHIADPVRPPAFAGSYDTLNEARRLAISGNYAYVADRTSGVQVIDISDPTSPDSAGTCDTPGQAYAVAISGDYAFVADYSSGLQVIDISDPTTPISVANHDTQGPAVGVAVSGDYAYVADYPSGLQVIDISDPTSPDSAGSYDTPGYAWGVAVSGDYAYVADGFEGLQVIDVSDPTSPTLAGTRDTYDHAWDIAVSGDYAYIADGWTGLQVIDISHPTNPTLAGSYDTSDPALGVALSGDLAFVAVAEEGVHVLNISDPTNPTHESTHNTPDEAWSVIQDGDYAFIADGSSGLQVIQVFWRRFDPQRDSAQSSIVHQSDDLILRGRLMTTQTDSIRWEVSADSGGSWQEFLPGEAYRNFVSPGSDLVWRSCHLYKGGGVNPACSNLEIEWLYEFPVVESITDIPNDQGKQVSLSWASSGYDIVGSVTPIVEYAVYRRIDSVRSGPPVRSASARLGIRARAEKEKPDAQGFYPPGDWHFILTVPARTEDEYAVVVPTLADSTVSGGQHYTTFFVSALTDTPGIYFDSPVDSGYSVDNLAPTPPPGFMMTSATDLAWDECPDEDFDYFTVYGSALASLDSTAVVIGYTIGIAMDVTGHVYDYYHTTATDFSGNEGDASSVENAYAGLSEIEDLPTVFALRPNRPNPFESSTVISFDLPEPCAVRLEVVDVQGRVVRVLTDKDWSAGRHSIIWTAENPAGEPTGPGVYFVRMHAGDFTARIKMLCTK